jgi:hypothetical protein
LFLFVWDRLALNSRFFCFSFQSLRFFVFGFGFGFFSVLGWAQSFEHARQVLYHLAILPILLCYL